MSANVKTDKAKDRNDFIWKVLVPEIFVKFYMDLFGITKQEAEERMYDTPIRGMDSVQNLL